MTKTRKRKTSKPDDSSDKYFSIVDKEIILAEAKLSERIRSDLDNVAGYLIDKILREKPQSLKDFRDSITDSITEMISNEIEGSIFEEKRNE